MEQTLTEFLTTLGFESHPFNATNADDEPRLNEYFVEPPYFASVYGDPADPKSCVVFAPRGAGKSAQRRMVETRAPESEVLCVTYDEFRNPRGARLTEMTLDDHLQNLSRILAVGLLTWMAENRESAIALDKDEKRALQALAHALLSTATRAELNDALQALRNLSNKAKKVWNDNNWLLNAVLSIANIATGGSGGVLTPAFLDDEIVAEEAPRERLQLLGRLAQKVGLSAIYVLVDRIDETQETGKTPRAAYQMISPLMHELKILESADSHTSSLYRILWRRFTKPTADGPIA